MKTFRELVLIVAIAGTACNQEVGSQMPKEANLIYGDFYAAGQIEQGSYTFCSYAPKEVQYSYKNGAWKYWNLNGELIANGTYKPVKQKIEGEGGCPFEIISGKINRKEWQFWDGHGNTIAPSDELLDKLEKCEVIRTK
jgi:hypothetical protein